jgi:hypothetical protein
MAKGRGVPVVLAFAAALACAREGVPTDLIGRWTSDDPRYSGRSLEIGGEQITFGGGGAVRMSYRLQGVEREVDPATGTLYRVYYDAPGEPERALQVRLPTPGRLRIENHSELWTREGAPSAGG